MIARTGVDKAVVSFADEYVSGIGQNGQHVRITVSNTAITLLDSVPSPVGKSITGTVFDGQNFLVFQSGNHVIRADIAARTRRRACSRSPPVRCR